MRVFALLHGLQNVYGVYWCKGGWEEKNILLRVIPTVIVTKLLSYLSAMVLTYILTLSLAHLFGREEEERTALMKSRDPQCGHTVWGNTIFANYPPAFGIIQVLI